MNARVIPLAAVLCAFLLAGCGGAGPTPETHYYRLAESSDVTRLGEPATQRSVVVKTPRATGVRNERNMLYSEDDAAVNLKQYHQHYWEESPANLVQASLIDYLRARDVSPTVVRRSSSAGRITISSWLKRFERVLSGDGRSVVVVLEFRVDTSGVSEPMLIEEYKSVQPVARSDMQGTALTFSLALDDIAGRFTTDFERALENLD